MGFEFLFVLPHAGIIQRDRRVVNEYLIRNVDF